MRKLTSSRQRRLKIVRDAPIPKEVRRAREFALKAKIAKWGVVSARQIKEREDPTSDK